MNSELIRIKGQKLAELQDEIQDLYSLFDFKIAGHDLAEQKMTELKDHRDQVMYEYLDANPLVKDIYDFAVEQYEAGYDFWVEGYDKLDQIAFIEENDIRSIDDFIEECKAIISHREEMRSTSF